MREEDIDKLLKNKINSEIKAPEELKNRIKNEIKNIKEDKKTKSKLRVIQSIAAVAVFSILGMTTYATVTKNPILEKMGLIKGSTKYDEISENINQDISNEYANILLNKMAADDAYIIMEYNVKLTQEGIEKFGKIQQDINSGYKINITNTVKINNENIEQTEGIKEYSNKISDTEYKIYQIIDITNIKNKELNIEISEKYLQANDNQTEINKSVIISATKNDNIKSFETIENKIDNKTIKIEDFQNTGFETFVKISVDIDNLKKQDMDFYSENYPNHLSFTVLDNNNNYISNNCYNKVAYIQDNLGNKQDILTSYEENNISFDNAKAHLEYLITLGNIDENIKNIKIVPYTFVLQDERKEETEEYYNNLKWYKLQDGNYSQTSTLGGKIDITNIEIGKDKIKFYYNTSGKITGYENMVLLRINDKNLGFNIIEGTNGYSENINSEENYIEFDRNIENTGIYSNNFKNDDDYKLNDLSKIEFTLLVEPENKILNNGINIKIPNKNENYLTINKVEVKELNNINNISTNNSSKTTNLNNSKVTELNINSEQIAKLYSYIPAFDNDIIEKNAYQTTKTTGNNLSNEYLLKNAFKNLELKESNKKPYDSNMKDNIDWYRFDAKLLQAKVKEMYGKNITNQEFRISSSEQCGYEDGEYLYSVGGGSSEDIRNIRKIEKAYEDEENIYIEDKYLCLKIVDDGDSCSARLFATSDSSNSLYNLENTDELYSIDNTKLANDIINKYGSNMTSYKHTFKKSNDGSYYWESTENVTVK